MQAVDWASFRPEDLPDAVLKALVIDLKREVGRRRMAACTTRKAVERASPFRAIRGAQYGFKPHHLKFFERLMSEDWSHLFSGGDPNPIYYVYAHVTPGAAIRHMGDVTLDLAGVPFYIGKGVGGRAHDLKRNEGHGQQLRHLLGIGAKPERIVSVIKDGLTEAKAFELESKLIYFFGTKFDPTRNGPLVNLTRPATPHDR